jgi:hypothetical protein
MEPVAIFLILIVLVLIILFVTRPFFEPRRIRPSYDSQEHSSLMAERERLLTALQELDSDQALGKIPAEEYHPQRTALLKKGAEVLRKLDAFNVSEVMPAGRKEHNNGPAIQSPAPLSDEDLEDMLAKRRTAHKEKPAGFCPECGKPILQSDVFCPSCGSILKS